HTRCLSDWSSDVCSSDLEFNALAIGQHSQTPLDIELRYDRAKARLDLLLLKPALVRFLQFFEIRFLFAQKALRQNPAFIGWKNLGADQCHRAALVVFANAFACARSGNAGTNDEIITPNHMGKHAQ